MLNKCQFIGRTGRDVETRFLQSGQAVGSVSIAVDDSYKDKSGEWQKRTEWIPCTIWGKTAEYAANSIPKGALVYVEGSWKTETYKDKQGVEKTQVKLNVSTLRSLEKRSQEAGASAPTQKPAPQAQEPHAYNANDDMDMIPF
jgi:single-strand DNA-binding protein